MTIVRDNIGSIYFGPDEPTRSPQQALDDMRRQADAMMASDARLAPLLRRVRALERFLRDTEACEVVQ